MTRQRRNARQRERDAYEAELLRPPLQETPRPYGVRPEDDDPFLRDFAAWTGMPEDAVRELEASGRQRRDFERSRAEAEAEAEAAPETTP